MAVTMTINSVNGLYTFPADEMPLIQRRVEYARQGDVGYSLRRRNVTLSGFFLRNSHAEIMSAYQELLRIVNANDATLVYSIGTEDIINNQVYIDDYTEPEDWKEYEGNYQISMHYFEVPKQGTELGIQASYTSPGGTFHFDPTPNWSGGFKRIRPDFRSPVTTPSGQALTSEQSQTLTGWLVAPDAAQMQTKINELAQVCGQDGQLQYGAWINNVRIEDLQLPNTFPRDFCPYTIVFKYDTSNIIEYESTRSIARVHNNPKFIVNPYCGTKYAKEYAESPQEITYSIRLRAYTVASAREFLANEASFLIEPGGVEVPGGTEVWSDMNTSVAFTCTKWYPNAVIPNLAGT